MNIEEIKQMAEKTKEQLKANPPDVTSLKFENDVKDIMKIVGTYDKENLYRWAVDHYLDKYLPDSYKELVANTVEMLDDEGIRVSAAVISKGRISGLFDKENIPDCLIPEQVYIHELCVKVFNKYEEEQVEKAFNERFHPDKSGDER